MTDRIDDELDPIKVSNYESSKGFSDIDPTLFIILLIAIGGGLFVYYKKQKLNLPKNEVQPNKQTELAKAMQTLKKAENKALKTGDLPQEEDNANTE